MAKKRELRPLGTGMVKNGDMYIWRRRQAGKAREREKKFPIVTQQGAASGF